MEFEDMGRIWREDLTGEFRRTRVENLADALGRANRLNSGVRRRLGLAGMLVALPLIAAYGYLTVRAPTPLATAGAGLLAAWAAAVLLWFTAMNRSAPTVTLPVTQAIRAEVARLRELERFRSRANWVHALMAIGYFMYVFGVAFAVDSRQARIATMSVAVSVFAIVELAIYLPRRRRPSHTRVLREDLESWLDGLENSDLTGAGDI